MIYRSRLLSVLALLAVGACTTTPTGPSVLALPGTGKSLDEFRADDLECQQFALAQVRAATPAQAANGSAAYPSQRQYDFAYLQCMYAKGHRIPVPGGFMYFGPGQPGTIMPPPAPPPDS